MIQSRKLNQNKTLPEDSGMLFYLLLLLLFYPPLVQGLFMRSGLLITHILTSIVFAIYIFFTDNSKKIPIFNKPLDIAGFGLLIVYILSSFSAAAPRGAVQEVLKLINYFLIYFLVSFYSTNKKNINKILAVFYSSGVLVSIIGIFGALNIISGEVFKDGRIYSTLQYPNTLASYLICIIFIGLYMYTESENRGIKALFSCGNYLMAMTFFWTQSRGALLFLPISVIILVAGPIKSRRMSIIFQLILSFAIGFAAYIIASPAGHYLSALIIFLGALASFILSFVQGLIGQKLENIQYTKKYSFIAVGIAVLICSTVVMLSPVKDKAVTAFSRITGTSLQERNVQERLVFYKDALKIIKEHPVLGVGGDGWAAEYQKYQTYGYSSRQVHEYFLQLMVETGFLGLAIFVALLGVFVYTIFSNIKKGNKDGKVLNWLLLSITISIYLSSLVDFNLTFGCVSILLWSMFGIARGISERDSTWNIGKHVFIDSSASKIVAYSICGLFFVVSTALYMGYSSGEEGVYYFNNDRFDDARQYLESATSKDPLNVNYKLALAQVYNAYAKNKKDTELLGQAMECADSAVNMEPDNPDAHTVRGDVFLKMEKVNEAIAEYEKAVELAPTKQSYYEELADLYLRAGKYYAYLGKKEEARKSFTKSKEVPGMIKKVAMRIPFKDMPWIEEQYNLSVSSKIKKIVEEANENLSQL